MRAQSSTFSGVLSHIHPELDNITGEDLAGGALFWAPT